MTTAPLLTPEMSAQESALAMAAGASWYVFPLDHPELPQCAGPRTDDHDPATCDKRGKHPAIKWDTGASTTVHNIHHWWSGNPRNVGIHCGKSALLIIDEDDPGELARFAADHGVEIPDTFTVQTAKGKHYYFTDTEAGLLGDKEGAFGSYAINIRSGNGYVVAHGSKHETGITYLANGTRAVADLPRWVVEAIRGEQTNGSDAFSGLGESREGFELPDVITEGHRDEVLYRYACSLRSYDLSFNTALILMKDAWIRCEQPPVTKTRYEWDTAVSKLKGAYGRYDGGRSEKYQKPPEPSSETTRRIRLTPLSTIKPRPVRWAWADPEGRIPNGELTLTPGRGGLGKSTFHAWVIAHLTRGTLPGAHFGKPKPCIIAASEDSYERTVVPRLIAAGADMDLVYRVDVVTETNDEMTISLPRDIEALIVEINRVGVALLSLDPVMSLVFSALDTHKDREMRLALEPLARLADRTDCAVLGNAHFNKSTGSDPLTMIMGSSAFGNVTRAALGFARDTEDGSCVISQIKNNLGRLDLPSLKYRIESITVDTDEGPADVGKLVMDGESNRSVADILRDRGGRDDGDDHNEVEDWLAAFLDSGSMKSTDIYKAADASGYSKDQVKRAKKKLGIKATHPDITGPWFWEMPQGSAKESKGAPSRNPAPLPPLGAAGTCQALTWRVCENPNCQILGGCVLADNDESEE